MRRTVGRLLAEALLGVFYVVGWLVGGLVRLVVTTCAATRLGYTDARKRGKHGSA